MLISDITKSGGFVRLIELFPPGLPVPESMRDSQRFDLSLRFEKLVESMNALEALADGFSLPELKDAERIHLNSVGLATELKRRTGSAVIPTLTLRDSNRQNILGTAAFALYAGIENVLIVRGDPYPDEKGSPKNVYDIRNVASIVTSIRQIESHLSNGARLCIISPINLLKMNDPSYLQITRARELSGVDMFLAESLFEDVETYADRIRSARKSGLKLPMIHTIFPLRGYDDAIVCVKKFGWNISEKEILLLKSRGAEYGIEMARQRYKKLLELKAIAQGVCISTRGDTEMARLITA
ncbi:MAG: methylenetetrahydrofolate reductase [Nitrososphaerales archaeon]